MFAAVEAQTEACICLKRTRRESEVGLGRGHHDDLVSQLEMFQLYLFVSSLIANPLKLGPVS